ncbi:MAG TPA: hypothetical protein VF042_07810 [Gemmatimonadaceae bacterium]
MPATLRDKVVSLLTVTAAIALSGCSTVDFLTDDCDTQFIRVTWPASISQGGNTSNVTLFQSITPVNIDPEEFRLLRDVLINGNASRTATVVWTVPAFDVNGGYIALTHTAPLAVDELEPVNFAFDGGGWGASTASRALLPAIAVRGDNNFIAKSASGTITTVSTAPLRLDIDVTVRNAANQTMQISGEAKFEYERVPSSCS